MVSAVLNRASPASPQIGYIIPLSKDYQGYLNIKGYKEFASENRLDGWNTWLTFAIAPAERSAVPPSPPELGHEISQRGIA